MICQRERGLCWADARHSGAGSDNVQIITVSSMPNDHQRLRKIPYTAPLLGNIRQILTGLQGFDSMAREVIQNADDAGARKIRFSIEPECLRVWNDGLFESCGLATAGLGETRSKHSRHMESGITGPF